MTPTFGPIADPLIDFISCTLGVAEVQASGLTFEVFFVLAYKCRLHGEALLTEQAVGNQQSILVGLSCQGLVQFPQHLVRTCADQINISNSQSLVGVKLAAVTSAPVKS